MPVYEYHCKSCGKDYSQLKPMDERGSDDCDCGGVAELVMSSFSSPGLENKSGSKSSQSSSGNYIPCPTCLNIALNVIPKILGRDVFSEAHPFSDN